MSNFEEECLDAVKRFINTVVIIDDEATYSQDVQPVPSLISPPLQGGMTTESTSDAFLSAAGMADIDEGRDESFDANTVINSFADMGIICCVQNPINEDNPSQRAIKLALHADILILDWVLNEDRTICKKIIKTIVKGDKQAGGRIRLIVVYTAQGGLAEMLADVKTEIDALGLIGEIVRENFTLKYQGLRICFINKKGTRTIQDSARVVNFTELSDVVIKDFCDLVKGLIPCATMHAISAIREHTHGLISLLGTHLDGVFCAHRALIPAPADSVDYALNLISKEVEATIHSDKLARSFLAENNILNWFDSFSDSKKNLPPGNGPALDIDSIRKCLKEGVKDTDIKMLSASNWLNEKFNNKQAVSDDQGKKLDLKTAIEFVNNKRYEKIKDCKFLSVEQFHRVFYETEILSRNASKELSRLCCTSKDNFGRRANDFCPVLSLGTIIFRKDILYLCLQPPCDSIRLNGKTNFLFIELYKGGNKEADLLIKIEENTYKPFLVKNPKPKIVTICFDPLETDRIVAFQKRKELCFKAANRNIYKWIAELRHEKAQAIAHNIGWNTSRIGFEEFELLRRKGKLN